MAKTIRQFYLTMKRRPVTAKESEQPYGTKITMPEHVADVARTLLQDECQEVVLAIFLSRQNRVIGFVEAARGGFDSCAVDPRVLFSAALAVPGCCAIVLAHNHPSGDPDPSAEDVALTERVHKGAKILGLELLDHLVIGADGTHSSLAEKGLMP